MAAPEHYERVQTLLRKVYQDTMFRSDPALDHPLYAELIDMGPEIVPALLRQLEEFQDPDDLSIWHAISALYALTEVDPIPQEHAGRLREIIGDWLEWGRKEGIKWDV